ncbi:MAG: alpha/beta hydrolase [Bacteroidota bacterium]
MKKPLFFLFLLVATACYKDPIINGQYSGEYYIRHEGVDMPVYVRGNVDSEVFLFFLHGGPKLSGIEEAISNQFANLHEQYAMVYYDQRSGGFTHGNRNENISEEQLAKDLDVVVDFIKSTYSNARSIFLMGHSWGGYLGTLYLTDATRQDKITAWIELAGNHNQPLTWLSSRDFVLEYAQAQIDANAEDKSFWEEAIEKVTPITTIEKFEDILDINFFAQVIDRRVGENSVIPKQSRIEYMSSPAGIDVTQKPIPILDNLAITANLNPLMPNITLPSLIMSGRLDAIVPLAVGENAMEFLGTPDEDKSLVILEKSGHDIWKIEQERFVREIENFVEKYK